MPYFRHAKWSENPCNCSYCTFMKEYTKTSFYIAGAWCDPRRGYSESETDFLKRIPDGFITYPLECDLRSLDKGGLYDGVIYF